MNRLLLVFFISFQLYQISCIPAEEVIDDNPTKALTFSSDTILFDTLFTTRGSATRRLKVFNPNLNAVNIDRLYLGRLDESQYKIVISGVPSYDLSDVQVLGGDSILVLIDVLIDPTMDDLPFLVKDSIILETNHSIQDVKLVAWGQNARFLGDIIISCNSIWSPELPYVLYKSILIDSLCKLSVEAGTRIYSSPKAFIYVKGTLEVNGNSTNPVLFYQERQELKYENLPGQWGGIFFLEGSHDNVIKYASLRNAQYGLRIGTPDNDTIPDVIISNSIIENMTDAGVLSFTSDLYMENCLINNCGVYMLANLAGGSYQYVHCTFANYSQFFFRQNPSFIFSDNVELSNGEIIAGPTQIQIVNSILWGSMEEEIQFSVSNNNNLSLSTSNNILKSSLTQFEGNNNQLSTNTGYIGFADPDNYDYRLDSLSPAVNMGADIGIEIDLPGAVRDSLPDIGAYEFIPGTQ
ncbi:right-handed parallel beta-helix repeat-containing protein [Bacteroidota bacterium]